MSSRSGRAASAGRAGRAPSTMRPTAGVSRCRSASSAAWRTTKVAGPSPTTAIHCTVASSPCGSIRSPCGARRVGATRHMPRPELWITVVITIAALGAVHSSAFAQGTGRSMYFDISARSAALGNASTALPWGDLDHWANPALLGYVDGIRYAHQRTQLVPGLAPDVFFTTDYMQVGAGGLGVVFSGKPLDRGGVHLDYGQSEGIDESGNPTGLFDAYERVKAWGVGGSALRLIDNLFAATAHHMLRLSRYADVSAG